MTEHEAIQHGIPDYVASRLDAAARRQLELHLIACTECQELVACCERMALDTDAALAEHPDAATLKAYARGPSVRDGGAVDRHVRLCASCAVEVGVWSRQDAPERLGVAAPPRQRAGWFAARPLLAGAAAGAGIVLLALQLVPERPAEVWNGTAQWLLLDEPSRGAAVPATITVVPGQPYLPLGVHFTLPPDAPLDGRYRFVIRAADDKVPWQHDLSVSEIREQQQRTWVVGFLVPAGDHPPGRYTLEIVPEGAADALARLPFEILPYRQSPTATNAPQ